MNRTKRNDIQFLRAFAVISILIFHVSSSHMPGGFVGVDIFFVISGYLITGQIISKLRRETFSLSEFYFNRGKRLFPALLFMLLTVTAFLYFEYLPTEFEDYSKSLIAAVLYASNFWFYVNFDYFNNIVHFP